MWPTKTAVLRLLLVCANVRPTAQEVATIRQLLSNGIDWTHFARQGIQHGLVVHAGRRLIATAADLLPPEILAAFQTAIQKASERGRAALGELTDVLDALEKAGIKTIVIRGVPFGDEGNEEIPLRIPNDLDFLVHAQDLPMAVAILRHLGYEHRKPFAAEQANAAAGLAQGERLSKPGGMVNVVLHTQLASCGMIFEIDHAELWRRSRGAMFNGRSIMLLAPEDDLVILAVRGGNKVWQRIMRAADFARFLQSQPGLDWAVAAERARAQGSLRMVLLAASLARRHFDAAVPDAVQALERADALLEPMAARILKRWETEKPAEAAVRRDWQRLHDGLSPSSHRTGRPRGSAPAAAMPRIGGKSATRHDRVKSGPSNTHKKPNTMPLPDRQTLLATPTFFPLIMNEENRTLSFIQMSRETYRQQTSLDQQTVASGPGRFSATLAELLPIISEAHSPRPLHYVLHGAFCGSTLLARYLEGLPHCFVLKEPGLLGQLARLRVDASGPLHLGPDEWADWFRVAASLFSRIYPPDISVVIKPTDLCNWMGDILLDHDERTKIVFLNSPLRQFLASVLSSKTRRDSIRRRVRIVQGCLAQVPQLADAAAADLTDGQSAAAIWLFNNHLCDSWLARPDASRILPLLSTTFFAHPKDTLKSVAEFLGLMPDESIAAALAAFQPLSRHSKRNDMPYDAERRAEILDAADLKYREEIDPALSWAKQRSSNTELSTTFAVDG